MAHKVFSTEPTLVNLWRLQTIPGLKEIAFQIGIKLKSGLRKEEMLQALVEYVMTETKNFLECLYFYELEIFQKIVDGDYTEKEARQSGMISFLDRLNLLYVEKRAGVSDNKVSLPVELKEKIKGLLKLEMKRRKDAGFDLFEKLSIGLSNIYGVVPLGDIFSRLTELEAISGKVFDIGEMDSGMGPIFGNLILIEDEGPNLVSPFANYVGYTPETYYIDYRLEAAEFDLHTILDFGEMPYPKFRTERAKAFRKAITGRLQQGTVEDEIRKQWLDHQIEKESLMPDLNNYIFIRETDVNNVMRALMNFVNGVPFWRLRGHSSEEIGRRNMKERQGPMRIFPGPNLRSQGYTSVGDFIGEDAVRELSDRFEFPDYDHIDDYSPWTRSDRKVGRNEPCPCGSGKKYKNCCGK